MFAHDSPVPILRLWPDRDFAQSEESILQLGILLLIRVQSLWLSVNDTSQCLRGRNTTIRLISATRLRSAGHFVTPLPAVMSSPPAAPPSQTLQETAASRQPDNTGGRKWIIHKRFCAMDCRSLTSHVLLANSRKKFFCQQANELFWKLF